MTRRSGWCSTAPGCTHTAAEHLACQTHGPVCGCEAFGGHSGSQTMGIGGAQVLGSGPDSWDNGTARTGASTPAGPNPHASLDYTEERSG